MTTTNVLAIVQARHASTRLPGKALLDLAGKPALWHVRERLLRVPEIDRVVVATTAAESDRPIVDAVRAWGGDVYAYAGDVNDLLDRYISCGDLYGADIIVMVDGDCPLLHPPTVSRMVESLSVRPAADYARLDSRSIEGGVAVLRLSAYKKILQMLPGMPEDRRAGYREHATLCIMERPELFQIVEVPCFEELAKFKHRLWLDTPADYEFLGLVYREFYREGAIVDLVDVVEMLAQRPEVRRINAHVGQKTAHGPAGFLSLSGDPAVIEPFSRAMSEHYGVASRTGETSGALALLRMAGGGKLAFTHVMGAATAEYEVTMAPADAVAAADLVASAMGLPRLRSGYFQADPGGETLVACACPLCDTAGARALWTASGGVRCALCENCGHVYLDLRPSDRALESSYASYSQTHPESMLRDPASPFATIAAARADGVSGEFAGEDGPSNVLEVGCGYGHFLAALPAEIYRVGLEPSRVQAAFARRWAQADEIWQCGYGALGSRPPSWPDAGFDAVVSFHVLEHVVAPREFVKFCVANLRAGGRLILAVPDLRSLGCDLIETEYLSRGFHLHTFHAESLRRLLEECGLRVDRIVPEAKTAALKSSILAVATKPAVPENRSARADELALGETRSIAEDYFARLQRALDRVRDAFAEWRREGLSIAIYGAGVHTRALLGVSGGEGVAVVFDDDPAKQASLCEGVPVRAFSPEECRNIDVLVISSLASEDVLLERFSREPLPVKIVGVYRDLMNDASTVSIPSLS